jgi:hypothetical protein
MLRTGSPSLVPPQAKDGRKETTAAGPKEGKMPKAKAKAKTKVKTKVKARMTKGKARATREREKTLTENKPKTQGPRPSHQSIRGCSISTTTPWVWRSHLPPTKRFGGKP